MESRQVLPRMFKWDHKPPKVESRMADWVKLPQIHQHHPMATGRQLWKIVWSLFHAFPGAAVRLNRRVRDVSRVRRVERMRDTLRLRANNIPGVMLFV